MFQSLSKKRSGRLSTASHKNRGGAARRLRVEGMERRLMLSATTTEVTPEVPLFSSLHPELSYLAAPFSQEGGPILMADDLHGTSTAGIFTSDLPPAQYTGLNIGQGVNGNGVDGFAALDSYSGTFNVRDTSWQPVSMYLNYNLGTIEAKVATVSVNIQQSVPPYSEGGSIPISSVVSELKQQSAVATPAEKPVESHATETAGDTHQSTHASSAAASFISGEWGRASVFEIVGGARSAEEHDTLNVERAKSRGDQTRSDIALPLFVSDETGVPRSKASQTGTDQTRPDEQVAASEQLHEPTPAGEAPATVGPGSASAHSVMIESQSGKVSSETSKPAESRGAPTAMIESHDARVATVAAAMDELGGAGQTTGLWRRSRVAAGVVLVLALERVAAFHTREAHRKSSGTKTAPSVQKQASRRPIRGGLRLDAR